MGSSIPDSDPSARIREALYPWLDGRLATVRRFVLELEDGHELVVEPPSSRVTLRRRTDPQRPRTRGPVDEGVAVLFLGALRDHAETAGVPVVLEHRWERAVVCRFGRGAAKAVGA